jgi:hypothetical protein
MTLKDHHTSIQLISSLGNLPGLLINWVLFCGDVKGEAAGIEAGADD